MAARLAAAIPDGALKSSLRKFLDQVFSLHAFSPALSLDALHRKVSVKNIEYYRTDERVYHQVLDALLHDRPLRIEYHSPHTGNRTRRDILPLHLLAYMGTWHLIAHCTLRDGLRDFALSRIRSLAPAAGPVTVPADCPSLKDYLREHFGILRGPESHEVAIRFAPAIAPWIREQVWHPRQVLTPEPDGALTLRFPASDLREVKREVLRYGAQAQVLAPPALREEIREEINKMQKNYDLGHVMGGQV
jgi:predicted DNA-binding transcriptional regulator YafY